MGSELFSNPSGDIWFAAASRGRFNLASLWCPTCRQWISAKPSAYWQVRRLGNLAWCAQPSLVCQKCGWHTYLVQGELLGVDKKDLPSLLCPRCQPRGKCSIT